MEPKFQTSFIPKSPISTQKENPMKKGGSFDIFSTVATLLFIATLLAGGALFFYKRIVNKEILSIKADISDTRDAFQPETIKELIDFNKTIRSTNQLLQRHIAISSLFNVLQSLTIKPISFKDFSYSELDGQIVVDVKMEGKSYSAFAQQSGIFSKQEFIKDPEFSDFELSEGGTITATFKSIIDPTILSYEKTLIPVIQEETVPVPQEETIPTNKEEI